MHPDPSISLRDVKMDAVPCGWVNAYGKKQRGMNRHISCFGEKTRVSVVSGFKTQNPNPNRADSPKLAKLIRAKPGRISMDKLLTHEPIAGGTVTS